MLLLIVLLVPLTVYDEFVLFFLSDFGETRKLVHTFHEEISSMTY